MNDKDAELDYDRLFKADEAEWNEEAQDWVLRRRTDLPEGHDAYGFLNEHGDVDHRRVLLSPGKYWIGDPIYAADFDAALYTWETGLDGVYTVRRSKRKLGLVYVDSGRVSICPFDPAGGNLHLGVPVLVTKPVIVKPIPDGVFSLDGGFEFGPYRVT